MNTKGFSTCLGDGVYITRGSTLLTLTTQKDGVITNIIHLMPSVARELLKYLTGVPIKDTPATNEDDWREER